MHAQRILHLAARSCGVLAILLAIGVAHGAPAVNGGEAIYRQGITSQGRPIEASRASGVRVEGKDAACANCHRRSGFGAKEGRISIPPITGRYLYLPRASANDDLDLPYVENMRTDRDPYTDATLARAIRDGIGSEGKPLNYLMPHYQFSDAEMATLIDYLKHLDQPWVPGVADTVLHFATIITPDADPVKARGMLDVMERYFADKNATQLSPTPRLRSSRKMMFMVNRSWQLHVWRLTGPAAGWHKQLERRLAEEPVMAVVSGIGGANWEPVHAFCEKSALPCLFPNVEAPPARAENDFYSLYFSKGVLLEAGLIAKKIREPDNGKTARVVQQVYRAGDSGEAAAKALARELEPRGIKVRSLVLPSGPPGQAVKASMRKVGAPDALILWLRPGDLEALGDTPAVSTVFMSGLMGGLERSPLPASWFSRTQIAYPFDLPEQRRTHVDHALGWFRIRQIPIVAEQVQADTFLACGLLAETLNHMVDTFVRDYLIERIEDRIDHRIITGYYPRLTLAPGQRFASKGGYIVRFSDAPGKRLIADNLWVVP